MRLARFSQGLFGYRLDINGNNKIRIIIIILIIILIIIMVVIIIIRLIFIMIISIHRRVRQGAAEWPSEEVCGRMAE